MRVTFQRAAFSCAAILLLAALNAHAAEKTSPDGPREITLDIDRDGKPDRAVLTRVPESADADLTIFLNAGTEALDPSRPPALLRKNLVSGHVIGLETKGKGSLIVRYGCGGCSNDTETALTIIYRGGDFWVAGFTVNCDINYLTGKGVFSRGPNGKRKPISAKFKLTKLADWSDDKRPTACGY